MARGSKVAAGALAFLVVMTMVFEVRAQTSCPSVFSLQPCLGYVSGGAFNPACCTAVNTYFRTAGPAASSCLCTASRNAPNKAAALGLPHKCGFDRNFRKGTMCDGQVVPGGH